MDISRTDIDFPSGPNGDLCRGWLYLPQGHQAPYPTVVMAHGLGGVKAGGLEPFAQRFAQAGYACIVFDYRYFGASEGQPRQLLDIPSQHTDYASALTFARNHPELDKSRLVLWGTSFSGGHVIAVAADDGGVAAVISQCPFTDGPASALALDWRSSLQVLPFALRDLWHAARGQSPVTVAAAGAPHSRALMTAADALPGYRRLHPDDPKHREDLAARIALKLPFYVPGRRTAALRCPILFCICSTDSVAPARATEKHAARASQGEIKRYAYGHFDIYSGDGFEAVIRDQLDFLSRHI